ncbi:hypothetical protein A3Q56_03168 [Intoshia linei]|uniref:PDZ domain-containing protein n=1 Tax=Intoshia linei TaxID=1819745 RepID=A0A177B475_9BILA|nr:hypothetical protein A3Q56_03168 [Intoshia linei]
MGFVVDIGNSGGPLIDMFGEVIGLNALNLHPGFSFAIPANKIKKIMSTLKKNKINYKQVPRQNKGNQPITISKIPKSKVNVGITLSNLSEHLMHSDLDDSINTINVEDGVVVLEVEHDSPADKAGLKPQDVIISINSTNIRKTGDLHQFIKKKFTLNLDIIRLDNKKFVTLKKTIVLN